MGRTAYLRLVLLCGLLGALLTGTSSYAQLTPADTGEFLVNSYTTDRQFSPRAEPFDDGSFIVVWNGRHPRPTAGQRYDSLGAPLGSEISFATESPSMVGHIDVATRSNGGFIAVADVCFFSVVPGEDGCAVYGRMYDSDGLATGTEFRVNTETLGDQEDPVITTTADGGFVVAWQNLPPLGHVLRDGSGSSLTIQRFDAGGAPVGTGFLANTYTTGNAVPSDIVASAGGGYVLVWAGQEFFNSPTYTFARVFDANDLPLSSDLLLTTTSPQRARVGVDAAGDFTVVASEEGASALRDIVVHHIGGNGILSGAPVTLVAHELDRFSREAPAVAVNPDGSYVLSWQNAGRGEYADAKRSTVSAQLFDANDVAVSGEVTVSSDKFAELRDTALALDAHGNFVVAWQAARSRGLYPFKDPDGSSDAILARRVCLDSDPDCSLCDGSSDPSNTDGDVLPDACDPCTDVDGLRAVANKVQLKITDADASSKPLAGNKVSYKLETTIPLSSTFSQIDPMSQDVRIRLVGAHGLALLDLDVPAGPSAGGGTAGWTVSGNGSKWRYRDRTDSESKVSSFQVQDRAKKSPGAIKVSIKTRGFPLDVADEDMPLTMSLTLGSAAAAAQGLCSEIAFAASECSRSDTKARCRR